MTDSALDQFLTRGTHAARLTFTPTPPTASSGYFWFETDTGDSYAWSGAAWVKVNTGGGGGGALTSVGTSDRIDPTLSSALGTGTVFLRTLIMPGAMVISSIKLASTGGSAGALGTPCIYAGGPLSNGGGLTGALLASGPAASVVASGVVTMALTTPYSAAQGDILMFGFLNTVAAANVSATSSSIADATVNAQAMSASSLPNPAAGVSTTNRNWGQSFWLSA